MGTCVNSLLKNQREKIQRFDEIPEDTYLLENIALPKINFHALFYGIKIKKCQYNSLIIKLKIDNILSYQTQKASTGSSLKAFWNIYHKFAFSLSEYELRNKFLDIEVYSQDKEIGQLRINLFMLWVGPYHLDFKLNVPQYPNCRISLNFKISQEIHLKIQNFSTQMIPIDPTFIGDSFIYSIQANIGQQMQVSSSPYILNISDQVGQSKITHKFHNPQVQFISNSAIIWKKQNKNEHNFPSFDKNIAFYQIYSSSLHIIFFKLLPNTLLNSELKYELESQCFISLAKFFTQNYTQIKDDKTNILYECRNLSFSQKTWLHGKQKGRVLIQFKFIIQSHIKQMQSCVRTENGIMSSSPIFTRYGQYISECKQIELLKMISNNIQQQFLNLNLNIGKDDNNYNKKQNKMRLINLLNRQLVLLQKSSKQSILFYQYKDQIELYKAQQFLIHLGFQVSTYIHQDCLDCFNISWKILIAILKRGQLRLSHMGFSKHQKQEIKLRKYDESLRLKIENSFNYLSLLTHLLKQTLHLLEYKGQEAQQIFAQSFCSYAYFRLPLFRQHILQAISREDDVQLPEWRGTQVNLADHYDSGKRDDFYDNLFDWQVNFYQPLKYQQRYEIFNDNIKKILQSDKWKYRLSKRNGVFYTFLENLIRQIEYVSVVSKYIRWHSMPGYNKLISIFLLELRRTEIRNLSERLKRCCIELILNQKLLNILVTILLNNTNIYDPYSVQIVLKLINNCLQKLRNNLRMIPSTFDYKYFLKGFKMILQGDHEIQIQQVLLLIYNNYEIFKIEFQLELLLYLLNRYFFKLFCSWSYNIRQIFYTLLITRIQKIFISLRDRNINEDMVYNGYIYNMKVLISSRYQNLLNFIELKVRGYRNIKNNDQFNQKYLYKKMRLKIHQKKKIIRQFNNSIQQNLQYLKDIQFPRIQSSKSIKLGNMINPYKLIYFNQQDMLLSTPKERELIYGIRGLNEFNTIKQQIKKYSRMDQNYIRNIKIKKIIDERQISTQNKQQW